MTLLNPLQKKVYRLVQATGIFDRDFYRSHSPDVAEIGMDLLEHYIVAGESEGRAPSMFFEPHWYRKQASKVPAEHSLLAHYLTIGDAEGLQPMTGFDPAHVRSQLPGRREPALVAFVGARAYSRFINPNRFFDYAWYLTEYPDVAAAGIDAYYHFVHVGADEGRAPSETFSWYYLRERFNLTGTNSEVYKQLMLHWRVLDLDATDGEPSVAILQDNVRANHKPSAMYEDRAAPPPVGARRKCDVYAFYLTQYHRIIENDTWWGEGFTEWHNVVRGLPRFPGHYQPRTPSALGFYDLMEPSVFPKQIDLAKQAGLTGFAFYYYNFGEQRLLEKPLERFLADQELDLGYFLIWANETWSRRWDGSQAELLLEQTYPDHLPETLAKDLSRHFRDSRYRHIDGRPLFVIYRISELPHCREWIAMLRQAFRTEGFDPLIYMAQTFDDLDPTEFGADGALEFPPHKHSRHMETSPPSRIFVSNPALRVWDYENFVKVAEQEPPSTFPLIRTCFPSWDNDSRRQGASAIVHGSTPAKFSRWLEHLVNEAESRDQAIVCINAWNEWGEGAYLEPDRHFGYAYLNTVQRLLHPPRQTAFGPILLVGHDAFPAGAQRLLLNLGRTLKYDFGVEVAYLLLRGDKGFDGLLQSYGEVAETHVVESNLAAIVDELAERGFHHAIVNSSATAPALAPLAAAEFNQILLVHELPKMLALLQAENLLVSAAEQVRKIIAPTATIANMLSELGIDNAQIERLPQGQYRPIIETERDQARERLAIDKKSTLIVGIGYGDHRKGADLFVEAAEVSVSLKQDLVFVWQGDWDPDTLNALHARITPLVGNKKLLLLPTSSHIDDLICAADCFLLPSREDPLPSVAIEAWSIGLPVVAIRNAGGISDLIEERPELGATTNPDGKAILKGIRQVLKDDQSKLRRSFSQIAFNWNGYVRNLLLQVYQPPQVDAVIIGYQHETYAQARLDSLVRQSLPLTNLTYYDVDPNDEAAASNRAKAGLAGADYIQVPPNRGRLNRAWAELASKSRSEFFHIAEGDDELDPTMIEKSVAALRDAPNAAFSFVGVRWMDEEGSALADHLAYPADVLGADLCAGQEITGRSLINSHLMVKNPILSVSSVVWRRELLLEVLEANEDLFDSLEFAFDWLLYLKCAEAGHGAVFVPESLCLHRQHRESFASRSDMNRHGKEIQVIYTMVSAEWAEEARASYLESLDATVDS